MDTETSVKVLEGTNVCEILPQALNYITSKGRRETSRNGDVLVSPCPVITVYSNPSQKVLFSSIRDANPAFHLLEAVAWMLSGANDAEFLNYYVKDFGERFAQDNGIIHGAYGHRWKFSLGINQLQHIIEKFKNNPLDRQCVLQMWDAGHEKWEGSNDLLEKVCDRPCNTQAYFRINNGKLDMSTTARSHDLLWGALGANAVHFPILQEYIAGMVGVPIGKFYQYSWNYHIYIDALDTLEKRCIGDGYEEIYHKWLWRLNDDRYRTLRFQSDPLVGDPNTFDQELVVFTHAVRALHKNEFPVTLGNSKNSFLWETAWPVAMSHSLYKKKDYIGALDVAKSIHSPDWQMACEEWLKRRIK